MNARRRAQLGRFMAAALATCLTSTEARAQRVVEVQVAPPFLRLRPGTGVTVIATAYDRDGMPVDARLVWRSTNINVATVDSSGAVRALAPGLAVITASTDSTLSRRHSGRTTILVMGNEGGWWMRPGPDNKALAQPGDTVLPAECSAPDIGLRNPGRGCWDIPPHHLGPIFLDPPATCTPPVTPPVFMARVEADGHVSSLRPLSESTCPGYQSAAADFVRALTFMPAHRNGRQVGAWTVVAVRSVVMRMYVPTPRPQQPPVPMPPRPDTPATRP